MQARKVRGKVGIICKGLTIVIDHELLAGSGARTLNRCGDGEMIVTQGDSGVLVVLENFWTKSELSLWEVWKEQDA